MNLEQTITTLEIAEMMGGSPYYSFVYLQLEKLDAVLL